MVLTNPAEGNCAQLRDRLNARCLLDAEDDIPSESPSEGGVGTAKGDSEGRREQVGVVSTWRWETGRALLVLQRERSESGSSVDSICEKENRIEDGRKMGICER